MALASCQDLAGEPAQTGTVVEAGAYPSLHTVPPRPQLSYPVEQRRAIVDGLVADLENARYTSGVVRYRSGLSGMPPPEPEIVAAVPLEVEPDPQSAPAAPSGRPVIERTPELLYEDDDLGSFLQDMHDDQLEEAPSGEPEARAGPGPGDAAPPGAGQPEAPAAPDRVGAAEGAAIVPAIMAAAQPEA
ncbi:MAG: hypothetical protein ACREIR_19220, partial [Geminicoccaceae bacterium]